MSNFAKILVIIMYRGFNLSLNNDVGFLGSFSDLKESDLDFLSDQRRQIVRTLNSFRYPDGSLKGSEMKANWFPQINADIFISHSHDDKQLAIALAGWLHEKFGLVSFIDSCIWGYANDLLQMIDNSYCYNELTGGYDYSKRNYSTSHVHMMLSVALAQMIDETECLFFLNTPRSLTPDTVIGKTVSPWIYSEIAMSRLIRRKSLEAHRCLLSENVRSFAAGGKLRVLYDLPTDHLIEIGKRDLMEWEDSYQSDQNSFSLDKLYERYGQK